MVWQTKIPSPVVLVVALSLSVPLAPFVGTQARAQSACVDDGRLTAPLWITQIDPIETDTADETVVTEDAAVFAHEGDELAFSLTIENRVPSECAATPFYDEASTNDLQVHVSYLPGSNGPIDADAGSVACDGTSSADAIQPQEVCQDALVELPGSVQSPAGEQRVRFIVFDADADDDGDGVPDDCLDEDRTDDLENAEGACAGAERVIVADKQPDLAAGPISWLEPEPARRHVENVHAESVFELAVENQGTYPNWNPNGNRHDDTYWSRSSFDAPGDGDLAPDEAHADEDNYDASLDRGPVCNWVDNDDEGVQASEFTCSYRRGARLDAPIEHELHRDGPDGPVVENDTRELYPGQEYANVDKPDAIPHAGNEAGADNTATKAFEAVDRFRRAGTFALDVTIQQGDAANDEATREVDLAGSDLAITDPRVRIETPDGIRTSCTETDPCPLSSTIQVDPFFANQGDDESTYEDTETVLDRMWTGAVYLDGEPYANATFDEVPRTTEGPQSLLTEGATDSYVDAVEIEPEDAGTHRLAIRLDHPDNYQGWPAPPGDDRGFVGERTEDHACTSDAAQADNAYCTTLVFGDSGPVEIVDVGLALADTDEPLSTVELGEEVCFSASVEGSPDEVEAVFEKPDGTPAALTLGDGTRAPSLTLHPAAGDSSYEECVHVEGPTGEIAYRIRASDGEQTTVSESQEFEILADLPNPHVEDVSIEERYLPHVGGDGDPTSQEVTATIANDGAQTGPLDVTVWACPTESPIGLSSPLLGCEELFTTTAGELADSEVRDYQVAWDTLKETGEWRVCTELEPVDDVRQDTASDDQLCRTVFLYA